MNTLFIKNHNSTLSFNILHDLFVVEFSLKESNQQEFGEVFMFCINFIQEVEVSILKSCVLTL